MIKIHDAAIAIAIALISIRHNADTVTDTVTDTVSSVDLVKKRSYDEKLTYILYSFINLTILYEQYRTFI